MDSMPQQAKHEQNLWSSATIQGVQRKTSLLPVQLSLATSNSVFRSRFALRHNILAFLAYSLTAVSLVRSWISVRVCFDCLWLVTPRHHLKHHSCSQKLLLFSLNIAEGGIEKVLRSPHTYLRRLFIVFPSSKTQWLPQHRTKISRIKVIPSNQPRYILLAYWLTSY